MSEKNRVSKRETDPRTSGSLRKCADKESGDPCRGNVLTHRLDLVPGTLDCNTKGSGWLWVPASPAAAIVPDFNMANDVEPETESGVPVF
ncbi:hypothetical protein GN956_G24942 [Arapaima gigas]